MSLQKTSYLQNTPLNVGQARPDFVKNEFDIAIYQKGYKVLHEKSIACPCKSKGVGGQLSDCKNCGGSGWVFINPIQTRMIIHSMNRQTQYKDWSEENRGTSSITCNNWEQLSFMDRITLIEGISVYNEILYVKRSASNLFFYTTYNIKTHLDAYGVAKPSIDYIALFESTSTPLRRLELDLDYTTEYNRILLDSKFDTGNEDLSITIRYKHNPQYHVIDIPRHTIATNADNGGFEDTGVQLPIHAVGRYAHYVLDAENYVGTRLIDNSYTDGSDLYDITHKCK